MFDPAAYTVAAAMETKRFDEWRAWGATNNAAAQSQLDIASTLTATRRVTHSMVARRRHVAIYWRVAAADKPSAV
jgi:hypothetical protein